jgi:Tfp pilus assembly protein PilW
MITRSVMDLMTRELRMAGFNPTNGALPAHNEVGCNGIRKVIFEATATRLRFKQDLNGNGAIEPLASEDVTYELVGSQVRRALGDNAATPLVDYVPTNGLTFRYYNNSNPPVELLPTPLAGCNLANVAKVRITVSANLPNQYYGSAVPFRSVAASEIAIRSRSVF